MHHLRNYYCLEDILKKDKIFIVLGIIPVIWLSLLIAPFSDGGIIKIIKEFPNAIENPFNITICTNTIRLIIVFLFTYFFGIGIYYSSKKNYRKREEHGSAKWGDNKEINKKYIQYPSSENKILSRNVSIGLDGRKHRRNLNVLIIGGSGAGKTRFYAKPNIMQCNTSFVILDPKGEILRDEGNLLKAKDYDVKILDLINMDKSHCYNPFVYIQNDNDVQKLVTNLFKATTPKGSSSQDPFWDTAAAMLLLALMFYLKYEAPEEEQNFPMIMEMLRAGEVKEDDDNYVSALDMLFNKLADENPEHIAVKYYRDYHSGSAKTLKSIQITLASRLEKFNLESLSSMTQTDELELANLGEKKTALFEKQWESIVGNCDEFLYLGGNEQSTHKYVSELLGKETIDLNSYGKSTGYNGNYSTNYQITGRELLTPDEVRKLNNDDCILFIRGELPIIDKKYDLLRHPNIELTTDGKGKPFEHGLINNSIATITIDDYIEANNVLELKDIINDYDVVYSDFMDNYLERRENNERKE